MRAESDLSRVPGVTGVITPTQCRQTARSIAAVQLSSGEIPWSEAGHTDPWDHVECAMALTAAGLIEQARAAYEWCRREQRRDGSWAIRYVRGEVEDANSDSNFCAYVATGVWHHCVVTGDRDFAERMWPTVQAAIDFVLGLQAGTGEIYWATGPAGTLTEALLTGCSSVYHSIRCALALAEQLGRPQPEWARDCRASAGLRRQTPALDGLVLPDPRRRGSRAGRARADRPALGRVRRGRPGHPMRQ
jgi:hypothetical protein